MASENPLHRLKRQRERDQLASLSRSAGYLAGGITLSQIAESSARRLVEKDASKRTAAQSRNPLDRTEKRLRDKEKALGIDKDDDSWVPDPLQKALEIIDLPRAALVESVRQVGDAAGNAILGHNDPVGADVWLERVKAHQGAGDIVESQGDSALQAVTGDKDAEIPLNVKRGLGFIGDVGLDPLNFVAPEAALTRNGGSKGIARTLFEANDAALNPIAQQIANRGVRSLSEGQFRAMNEALTAAGKQELRGGVYFNVPGTRGVGSLVEGVRRDGVRALKPTLTQNAGDGLRQVRIGMPGAARKGPTAVGRATSAVGGVVRAGAGKAHILGTPDHPGLLAGRNSEHWSKVRYGTADEARNAFLSRDADRAGRGAASRFEHEMLHEHQAIVREMEAAGVDMEDALRVLEDSTFAPNTPAAQFAQRMRDFDNKLRNEANKAAGYEFIKFRDDHAPALWTEDAIERLGSTGRNAADPLARSGFEQRAAYIVGEEIDGQRLVPAAEHPQGLTPRGQANEILAARAQAEGREPLQLFDFKYDRAVHDQIVYMARRVKGERTLSHLRERGVVDELFDLGDTAEWRKWDKGRGKSQTKMQNAFQKYMVARAAEARANTELTAAEKAAKGATDDLDFADRMLRLRQEELDEALKLLDSGSPAAAAKVDSALTANALVDRAIEIRAEMLARFSDSGQALQDALAANASIWKSEARVHERVAAMEDRLEAINRKLAREEMDAERALERVTKTKQKKGRAEARGPATKEITETQKRLLREKQELERRIGEHYGGVAVALSSSMSTRIDDLPAVREFGQHLRETALPEARARLASIDERLHTATREEYADIAREASEAVEALARVESAISSTEQVLGQAERVFGLLPEAAEARWLGDAAAAVGDDIAERTAAHSAGVDELDASIARQIAKLEEMGADPTTLAQAVELRTKLPRLNADDALAHPNGDTWYVSAERWPVTTTQKPRGGSVDDLLGVRLSSSPEAAAANVGQAQVYPRTARAYGFDADSMSAASMVSGHGEMLADVFRAGIDSGTIKVDDLGRNARQRKAWHAAGERYNALIVSYGPHPRGKVEAMMDAVAETVAPLYGRTADRAGAISLLDEVLSPSGGFAGVNQADAVKAFKAELADEGVDAVLYPRAGTSDWEAVAVNPETVIGRGPERLGTASKAADRRYTRLLGQRLRVPTKDGDVVWTMQNWREDLSTRIVRDVTEKTRLERDELVGFHGDYSDVAELTTRLREENTAELAAALDDYDEAAENVEWINEAIIKTRQQADDDFALAAAIQSQFAQSQPLEVALAGRRVASMIGVVRSMDETAQKALAEVALWEGAAKKASAQSARKYRSFISSQDAVRAFHKNEPTRQGMVRVLRDGWTEINWHTQGPEQVLDALQALHRVQMLPDGGLGHVLKVTDYMTNFFKAYATLTPGFIWRNTFGGVVNNMLAGVDETTYPLFAKARRADMKAMEAIRRGESVDRWAAVNKAVGGKAGDAYRTVTEGGILGEMGQSTEFAETLRKGRKSGLARVADSATNNPLTRAVQHANVRMEANLRGTLAMDSVLKGKGLEGAWDDVLKYHFDYADLSHFERGTMRRIFPFYTWTRKNLPLQMESFIRSPGKFNRYNAVKRNMELGQQEEDLVPSWFRDSLGIRTPFTTGDLPFLGDPSKEDSIYLIPDLPMRDLSLLSGNPDKWWGMLNPLWKAPIEQQSGVALWNGVPFREGWVTAPIWASTPGVQQALEATGRARRDKNGVLMMRDDDITTMESMIPILGRARRLYPNEEKYQDRLGTSILSMGLGLSVRANTEQDQLGELRRQERKLDEIAKDMDSLGHASFREFETWYETEGKPAR